MGQIERVAKGEVTEEIQWAAMHEGLRADVREGVLK
jgi:hypothetical protein